MSKSMYCKMAVTNLKKNKKFYLPYLLSTLFTVVTFFTICNMSFSDSLVKIKGGDQLRVILALGSIIIGFFGVIFLFYTNGFLMKQRKKELGLYCILGLEKKHMALVLFYEMIVSAVLTIAGGLIVGMVISKLLFLILLRLVRFEVTLKIEFTAIAYIMTVLLFLAIYVATYIKNLLQVHLTNPIDLLKGSNKGEKEPKASWLLALLGVICLGIGYYMALSIENPLKAMIYFFIAVIFVIVGTNLLFTSVSIYVLKFLKSRKSYYYNPRNFISVSGMIYRMKQNAAGLANICILSTMVIICMTSVFSLYVGQKDIMRQQFPHTIEIKTKYNVDKTEELNQIMEENAPKYGVQLSFQSNFHEFDYYMMEESGGYRLIPKDLHLTEDDFEKLLHVSIVPYTEVKEVYHLEENIVDVNQAVIFDNMDRFELDTMEFGEKCVQIVKKLSEFNHIKKTEYGFDHNLYVFVKDYETADALYRSLLGDQYDERIKADCTHTFYYDVKGSEKDCLAFENAVSSLVKDMEDIKTRRFYHIDNLEWYILFGGLFFIGTYFGLLFLIATVLIIYYKQITEGYDDRERFNIMQKVGMSRREVKKTIHKQVLMVFFLPILLAVCHTCFALPMLKRMFQVFYMFNTTLINLSTLGTVILYVFVYAAVYLLTARAYEKIVEY